jgi:hypothetical protein
MAKITGRFCDRKLAPTSAFDPRSFRWARRGRNWLLVGCPAGQWNPRSRHNGQLGRCTVGTRAQHVLVAAKPGRRCCPEARSGERCVVKP